MIMVLGRPHGVCCRQRYVRLVLPCRWCSETLSSFCPGCSACGQAGFTTVMFWGWHLEAFCTNRILIYYYFLTPPVCPLAKRSSKRLSHLWVSGDSVRFVLFPAVILGTANCHTERTKGVAYRVSTCADLIQVCCCFCTSLQLP